MTEDSGVSHAARRSKDQAAEQRHRYGSCRGGGPAGSAMEGNMSGDVVGSLPGRSLKARKAEAQNSAKRGETDVRTSGLRYSSRPEGYGMIVAENDTATGHLDTVTLYSLSADKVIARMWRAVHETSNGVFDSAEKSWCGILRTVEYRYAAAIWTLRFGSASSTANESAAATDRASPTVNSKPSKLPGRASRTMGAASRRA